jgi:adenosylcobinamide kinase / adenosylcobinamide-phosphate guanylyltransferase
MAVILRSHGIGCVIMPERHLILGAARSGKTRHAIDLAKSLTITRRLEVIYVATAQPLDPEMAHRIELHRAERPPAWATIEAPLRLADALAAEDAQSVLLVDCMTLWLSNELLQDFTEDAPNAPAPRWDAHREQFLHWLKDFRGEVLLVSNEVGAGIVPLSALARRFQDEQGRLNQSLAALCDRVTLVVAGIPLAIKGPAIAAPLADRPTG